MGGANLANVQHNLIYLAKTLVRSHVSFENICLNKFILGIITFYIEFI